MATTATAPRPEYPVKFSVDYPDHKLNKLTTFFRIFTLVPIGIVLATMAGPNVSRTWGTGMHNSALGAGISILFLPTLLMVLFRQKYPRWWYDWNMNMVKFSLRVCAYAALLRDEYPSTDEEQSVHLDIPYPDAKALNRWLPLVKWLLMIPHYIILAVLGIAAIVCIVISWFAILFSGDYPKSLFNFVVDVGRWGLRVGAYAFLLTTDVYPPFSFNA
jgi:hypothetical protein